MEGSEVRVFVVIPRIAIMAGWWELMMAAVMQFSEKAQPKAAAV